MTHCGSNLPEEILKINVSTDEQTLRFFLIRHVKVHQVTLVLRETRPADLSELFLRCNHFNVATIINKKSRTVFQGRSRRQIEANKIAMHALYYSCRTSTLAPRKQHKVKRHRIAGRGLTHPTHLQYWAHDRQPRTLLKLAGKTPPNPMRGGRIV